MGEYEDRVKEVRAENRWLELNAAPADDNGSHCCGAPIKFDDNASTELTWRYRCGQCGLLQDRR